MKWKVCCNAPVALACIIVLIIYGCAGAEAINESPTRLGWHITTMPGMKLGSGSSSIHAVLGYSRIGFKGGGGHNTILKFGPQVRIGLQGEDQGPWVGGELLYLRFSSSYDMMNDYKPSGSGFAVGPAAGYRFNLGKVPVSFYLAGGYLNRGDLKNDGTLAVPASNGFLARAGFDIHFMSLLSDRGR